MTSKLATFTAALLLSSAAAHADISISTKPRQNMNCDAGVCTATAAKAVLNITDLEGMLASGDITVKTATLANDIVIDRPVSWSTESRLTLDAQRTITARKSLTAAGAGALTIDCADGDPTGDLQFFGQGKVNLPNPGSNLTINGSAYTLVYDIAGLINGIANDPNGHFAIPADYDAAGNVFKDSPIRLLGGTLEGLGHAIAHLTIRYGGDEQYVGFIEQLTGVARDLLLEAERLNAGVAEYAGGLVAVNQGQIVHARVTGRLNGPLYVGGIAGYSSQAISKSSVKMTIEGGILGGLVADDYGTIDQCFVTGHIVGQGGGLVAEQNKDLIDPKITNSYASAQLEAGGGGLVAIGTIYASSSYSASEVDGLGSGGVVADVVENHIQNTYWDLDISQQLHGCASGNCAGVMFLRDMKLKAGLPGGFDSAIWGHDPTINNGYPYLLANPPPK